MAVTILVLITATASALAATTAGLAGQRPAKPRHDRLLQYKLDHLRRTQKPHARSSAARAAAPVQTTTSGPPADNLEILICPADQGECGGVPVPFSETQFSPTTQWTTETGNDYLFVWAGASAMDSQQGGIKVLYTNIDSDEPDPGSGVFYVPSTAGALTITSVSDAVVSFTYAGGEGTFDLTTDQFSLSASG